MSATLSVPPSLIDMSPELDKLLDGVFGTAAHRTVGLIDRYTALYALPCYEKEWTVDPQFFAHCTKAVNFVVIALYNGRKEVLTVYSSTRLSADQVVGWRLLGGPINDHKCELIEEAVNRIVLREVGQEVAELQPIASVKQVFRWGTNAITHRGLAFIARGIGDLGIGRFKEHRFGTEPPAEMAFLNREVFDLARKELQEKYFEPPLEEVECARRPMPLTFFHRVLFKPLMYLFASKPLKKKLASLVPPCRTVLDASAGDDELILEIAKNQGPDLCVANDISWRQMSPLRTSSKSRSLNIIFTNHNIVELPFAEPFDAVVYKNTLHHARTKNELAATLSRLKALSRRLIIADIEDPKRGRLSWLVHLYYVKVYGDEGAHFLTRDKFRRVVSLAFKDATRVSFDVLPTIKGNYMIAVIDMVDVEA